MSGINNNKDNFTKIYKTNHWRSKESFSGPGSELRQTVVIRRELPILFNNLDIKIMLDIPCGDFNWMKKVDFTSLTQYIGADIVTEIVQLNIKKYSNNKIKFVELDIVNSDLPISDLTFCRDCFVHLTFNNIHRAINNIKRSRSKYILMTTYNRESKNFDTYNDKWRPINFQIPPFNFCAPIKFIDTDFTDNGKQHPGNGMGLWKIANL